MPLVRRPVLVSNTSKRGTLLSVIISDNTSSSFQSNWKSYTENTYYKGSAVATTGGATNSSSRWNFSDLAPGSYRISATWYAHPNRAQDSPFTILDGTVNRGTVRVNQEITPNDRNVDGWNWEDIGTFSITSGSLSVSLGSDAQRGEYVVADALCIERVDVTPPPPSQTNLIIADNTSSSFQSNWKSYTENTYYKGSAVATTGSATNSSSRWNFSDLAPGSYRISATWYAHPNRAQDSPFTILDGTVNRGTVRVNQEITPNDRNVDGWNWEDIGTFSITSGSLSVSLGSDAQRGEYVVADALCIERVDVTPPPPSQTNLIIADNTSSSFQSNWKSYTENTYYKGSAVATTGGATNSSSRWNFSDLAPGSYRISATWYAHPNRAQDSPFTILDGTVNRGTVRVNQEITPNDRNVDGWNWEDIGTFSITSGSLSVSLGSDAQRGEYVVADALCIERVGDAVTTTTTTPPSSGQAVTIDDGQSGFTIAGGWSGIEVVSGAYLGDQRLDCWQLRGFDGFLALHQPRSRPLPRFEYMGRRNYKLLERPLYNP